LSITFDYMKIDELSPESEILSELGKRLARVRKQQRFTQDQLASMAGIGVATLRRLEAGQDGHMESWIKVLKALNMTQSIDALLPENFRSPMADVLDTNRRRRRHSRKPGKVWGDEST
ncbi:MAG: helix-turn-helix domain-containing protein, partial [Woeseiaceae bacterium]